jgi:very-short-patch-repair endonuclease
MLIYQDNLKMLSRKLRSNMTKHEVFLWRKLSRRQMGDVQFYRQKPIGPYIVDFCSKKPKLVIELDGGHHFEPANIEKDHLRDSFLKAQGFIVLRFDNNAILENWSGVGETILNTIAQARA